MEHFWQWAAGWAVGAGGLLIAALTYMRGRPKRVTFWSTEWRRTGERDYLLLLTPHGSDIQRLRLRVFGIDGDERNLPAVFPHVPDGEPVGIDCRTDDPELAWVQFSYLDPVKPTTVVHQWMPFGTDGEVVDAYSRQTRASRWHNVMRRHAYIGPWTDGQASTRSTPRAAYAVEDAEKKDGPSR